MSSAASLATATAFAGAHADAPVWTDAVARCLERLGEVPAGANLGFLYVTDLFAESLSAIVARLREATGIADWVGSTGIGVCGTAAEYFTTPALTLLVASLPPDSFRVFGPMSGTTAPLAADATEWLRRKHPMLGIVHADPRDASLAETVAALAAETSCFMVGGLASSRARPLHLAGRVVEGGVSGVFLAPEIAVATGLSQGCSPIGPTRRITEAQGNVILAIDDRPALEIFKAEIGELLARDLRRVGGLIFAAFPVRGTDTGDYLVRNIVAIDPRAGAIAVAGEFAEGDAILFCRRDTPSAARDLKRMLDQLKRRCGKATPKAGLYFSCLARGPNLFGPDAEELRMIRVELGDFPIAGFFANGEICNDRLYAYTGVLTVFL